LVQFTKLRLAGFKSFVDPTELLIYPGLTGIVGPNGCGKSNLVEALRWAMGETSAKSMRGGEMEDVIFSGSTTRPARNIAEVVLLLENLDRKVPSHFNDNDELEISRRIERGSGSSYSVNGHEARARDVQLLFADSATGAHSTALVSQGRVGALINAKPTDRRALLEEAAGITGLHSRRHEAELRLRAAEANLARLDDVIVTLESQLQALKKQARQATRYRNLNDHIRRVEATLLHLLWRESAVRLEAARAALAAAEAQVGELTGEAASAATRQAGIAADLPPLRQAEAEAAAELQRLNHARTGRYVIAMNRTHPIRIAHANFLETRLHRQTLIEQQRSHRAVAADHMFLELIKKVHGVNAGLRSRRAAVNLLGSGRLLASRDLHFDLIQRSDPARSRFLK